MAHFMDFNQIGKTHLLSSPYEFDAWTAARNAMLAYIQFPMDANFCDDTQVSILYMGKQRYQISGYVDLFNKQKTNRRIFFTVSLTKAAGVYQDYVIQIHGIL